MDQENFLIKKPGEFSLTEVLLSDINKFSSAWISSTDAYAMFIPLFGIPELNLKLNKRFLTFCRVSNLRVAGMPVTVIVCPNAFVVFDIIVYFI
jgi:hypothetical protein